MRSLRNSWGCLLAVAIGVGIVAPAAFAQGMEDSDQDVTTTDKHQLVKKRPVKVVQQYPNATRADPPSQASSDVMVKNVNQLHTLVDTKKPDEAIALANTMIADPKANVFDKSAAWQAIGYASIGKRDYAKAAEGLQNAISLNGLPNNDHYSSMQHLAEAQIASNQYDAGIATLDRLATETKLDKPEYARLRGMAYYNKKDYANAAQVLEKLVAATADKPDPNDQQMLFGSYFALKQNDKAVKLGEDIFRAHPDDKAALMNLAGAYQNAGQDDKVVALLATARSKGMLTTSSDYRNLYVIYMHKKGGEKDVVATINEGLQKGILQPNAEVYKVLGDSYFALKQDDQAIDAYKRADAVSTNGDAALNLAVIYHNQNRGPEAKAAAQRALQKGVQDTKLANSIVQTPGAVTKMVPKKK